MGGSGIVHSKVNYISNIELPFPFFSMLGCSLRIFFL